MIRSLALLSPYAPGILAFRGALIETLVARGVRVWVFAPDYDEATREAVRALGAEPVDYSLDRTGTSVPRDSAALFRLALLLRRLRPDATLGYFAKPVIYGTLAAAAARIPRRYCLVEGLGYLFTRQERESWRRKRLRGLLRFLYRRAFRVADRVFFLNPDDLATFVETRAIDPAKAAILGPIGVELADYPAAPVPSGPPVFLFIGRLLREKGVCELVASARLLRQAGTSARFVLLGGGDTNPGAIRQSEIDAWVREGVIEWPGHVGDVRPWLRESSVFVLPSYREGFPRSTQEAMAMGRAVITTDVPGCRETVVEGRNGFIVPVRDAPALAEAMLRFVRQPGLAGEMGRESRRIAEQRFDVHAANRRLLEAMGIDAA